MRRDKGFPELKEGDRVELTVNDQNLLVDVHLPGETNHHRTLYGQLAQPLVTGHGKAVIRTAQGYEEPHFIRPLARSKVASIPVRVEALFLIDEHETIADVTFLTQQAVTKARRLARNKSPLKNNFDRIAGVMVGPLKDQMVSIRSEEGTTRQFTVRQLVRQKIEKLDKGENVVLQVDKGEKVTDVAIPFFHETT